MSKMQWIPEYLSVVKVDVGNSMFHDLLKKFNWNLFASKIHW